MVDKRKASSKRVVWSEPGYRNGGEFRLTWGRIAAIVGILVAIMGAVPVYWTIGDHWMNRAEIKDAMKAHADHDASIQAWNQYGFVANRLEYLEDKKAECEAKQMVAQKLPPVDAAICTRYKDKLLTKTTEAADLKTKALETTKEKANQ